MLKRGRPGHRGLRTPIAGRSNRLTVEQKCSTLKEVKGSEFLRRAKGVARRRGLRWQWEPERGVGSHGTFYLGDQFTVVKDLKKDIGPGLLAAMCRQLGIRKEDL